MSTRNDRFNKSMRSLDAFVGSFRDPSKIAALTDRGAGVERMLDEIDPPPEISRSEVNRQRKFNAARMKLIRSGLGHLLPVLRLIVKNGNNRKESIWELTRS